MRFSKRKLHFLFFLCWKIETEKIKKQKRENSKNPIKIGFFLRWSSKNVKNQKKIDIWQKLPDTICVRKGEKTRIFVATICFGQIFFGPKQCKAGNTIKIGVSAEIAKKNKNDTFFLKGVF